MSDKSRWCSSYNDGKLICGDGFPHTSYCTGYTCHGCGAPSRYIPLCLKDEIPEHLCDDDGRMIFRQAEA